jgi:prepilin-type N-terminal cleavage/methylation domain-containing protein
MTRTRSSPRPRRGFSLLEVLVVLAIVALAALAASSAWLHTRNAAALQGARLQVIAVLRDAIARTQQTLGAPVQSGVVFTAGSGTLQEYVNMGGGWQPAQPAQGVSLSLPAGVVVQSWSFDDSAFPAWPYGPNAMRAQAGETDTGTYEAIPGETSPGYVTLVSPDGTTVTVHVTRAGTVY